MKYWVNDTARGLLNLSVHNGLRALPTGACSAFGAAQARFCPLRFPESDARARRLWSALRPGETAPAEIDAAIRRLWRNVARTMAEYSVIDRFWREGRVTLEGLEHVQAARDAGRPVILGGLHLSSWETIAAALGAMGYAVASTYEVPENRFEHGIVNRVRARYPTRMIYPDHAGGRAAYRCVVRDKHMFLFYIDELYREQVSAPAFGRPHNVKGNIGNAARLARLTDGVVIVSYCTRLGDGPRFKLSFTPPVEQMRSADAEADLHANVAAIDRVIAPIVTRHLDQWYYALDFDLPA